MSRRTLFSLLLLLCFLLAVVLAVGSLLTLETAPPSPVQANQIALSSSEAPKPVDIPRWMPALIGGFVMLQIAPLAVALRRSRKDSRCDVREINFLCEVPMYLGLLGSLLGVSMTQYFSGTVAAPLAYLTTISGILLFLLGKYLLALPYEQREHTAGRVGLL